MSGGGRTSEVGYGRPPKHSQWREGQSGNPRRVYKRTPKGTVAIIDAQFAKQINIAQNGEQRRVTVFEAILHQLWIKQMSGDRRAMRVLLKYREFASIASDNSEFIIIDEAFGGLT
jgi:Family of unknown function (DUF5681)